MERCKNTAVGSSLTALHQQPAGRGAKMSPLLPNPGSLSNHVLPGGDSRKESSHSQPVTLCTLQLCPGEANLRPSKKKVSVSFFAPSWPCAMSFWGPQAEMPIVGTQLLSCLLAHHYCFISSLPFLLPNTPSSTQATGDKTISFPIPTPWRQSPGFL